MVGVEGGPEGCYQQPESGCSVYQGAFLQLINLPVEVQHSQRPTSVTYYNFRKESGKKGAGDSPCNYWGYVLLEKLLVWKGEGKSKARERSEVE